MPKPLAFVIEDDPSIREVFAEALRANGMEVELLPSGFSAMERLTQAAPALVILDLGLPFTSGETILQMIRSDPRLAETRVIIASGESHRAEALEQQADLVLVKPVSYAQIADFVGRMRDSGDSAN
jgi:DNA-binding response OmpR family regulator